MRIHRLSVALLLFLEAWLSDAFVPRNVASRSTQLWSSSVNAAEIADANHELPDASSSEIICPDPLEYTNRFLDTENNPPGSLTWDSLRYAVPLLVSWGKAETREGAITVETLLDRLEAEFKAGNELLKLSSKHYSIAVEAWGKSGRDDSAENAERILLKMKEMAKLNPRLAPTRFTYNAVMNAHAKQGHTKRAAEILAVMENDSNLQLTTGDYKTLLGAYARVGEARKADDVLKRMVERCKDKADPCVCAPDIIAYNMLLDAWAKSNEKGRGQRAESILETLQKEYDNGEFAIEPDARTYAAVILAIVRSNEPLAIERAERILETALSRGIAHNEYLHSALLDAYASSTQPGFAEKAEQLLDRLEEEGLANAVIYNTVLKAWKGSNTNDESLKRMEDLLGRMEDLRFADTISYSTVIAAYANKGNNASAQRAEEILLRMQDSGAKPNTQTMNAVMNAWIRSGDIKRAERILDKMEKAFEAGTGDVLPTVVSYSTIMNGWAKSRDPAAVDKTEEIFRRMTRMYESGNEEALPNLFSFVTLIHAVVKSGQPGAAQRAEKLVFEMYDQYLQGNAYAKPNTQLVTAVIDCWQKSGDRDAGEKAEALLNWLVDLYEKEQDESLRPNEFTFTSAITAWGKSRKFGKAVKARALLTKMVDLHKSGIIATGPNSHCYTAVINACVHCENDDMAKTRALQITIDTYKEILDSEYDAPNQFTFSTTINALRNLMPQCEKRDAVIGAIFRKCAGAGHVEEFVIKRLRSSLNTERLRELVGVDAVGDDGFVDMDQLPSEWKRNARLISPRRTERATGQRQYDRRN